MYLASFFLSTVWPFCRDRETRRHTIRALKDRKIDKHLRDRSGPRNVKILNLRCIWYISHLLALQIKNTSESDPRSYETTKSHRSLTNVFLGFLCNCFSCFVTVRNFHLYFGQNTYLHLSCILGGLFGPNLPTIHLIYVFSALYNKRLWLSRVNTNHYPNANTNPD